MFLSRRSFLKESLGVPLVAATAKSVPGFLARTAVAARAQRQTRDTILVVVQLAGGNDSLNTVVPYADDLYAKFRPTLRIPAARLHKIDSHLGFHPQLSAFARLYREGLLGVIQGVGYPNPNQNHGSAMRIWQTANRNPNESHTGWLGRAVDQAHQADDVRARAAFVGRIARPDALNAERAIIPSIHSLDQCTFHAAGGADSSTAGPAADGPKPGDGNPLLAYVERATLAARATSRQVEAAVRAGDGYSGYPDFQFAASLRTIARLIRADVGIRIFAAELGGEEPGGFDTHAGQVANHGALLDQLSRSVAAFLADLKRDGLLDRVVLVTFSEFGRTVRENGRRGTDHGSAQQLFIAGGKVRGGLIGKHPPLDDLEAAGQRTHTDFRRVYATLLDRWLGIDSRSVLGAAFDHVDFLA